ncbi:MAG: hypothetical protein V1765_01655 [bacterium]
MPQELQQLGDIFKNLKRVKPPAYQWQDLALWVIKELRIPNNKRSAVFKVCKAHNETVVRQAVNDTKELCSNGQSWKYFFKIISTVGQAKN